MDFVWDIETFPNVFLLTAEHADSPLRVVYEISDRRNDSAALLQWLQWLRSVKGRMIGFNSLGFDYPVLHTLIRMGRGDAETLYRKAMAIIESQDGEDRWTHTVNPTDRFIEQIDLFRIHHFDNKARATSLKVIEFNLRAPSVEDLPFPVGMVLTNEQIDILRRYNVNDVENTKRFYHKSLDMIRFREELTEKYSRDFMNHNDTKIGKDYFVMKLEEAGVACYTYGSDGRNPRQTPRPSIALKDAILPSITFNHPEFNRVLAWLREQAITETKGVFNDLVANVRGFDFVFGLGGIHGSIENMVIESDAENIIIDLDVSSYYPNLAIANHFYPEHLGATFCTIYKNLYEQRRHYPKGSAENAMLKLALNGVYGDSNNRFSVFYDPLFTMRITLNGQLLLCKLAEALTEIAGVTLIQVNTDGLTIKVPRGYTWAVDASVKEWELTTGLTIEKALYRVMFIRDVNNYVAQREDGSVKRKGAYEHDLEWHQNHSALVVPKVAEKVLVEGAPIRETIEKWDDPYDFMLRVKVPRSSYLTIEHPGVQPAQLPNTTRYYVAKDGGRLFKWMPPLKGNNEWRRIGVESGWGVQVCNDIRDAGKLAVDVDYYVREVEKLCLGLA